MSFRLLPEAEIWAIVNAPMSRQARRLEFCSAVNAGIRRAGLGGPSVVGKIIAALGAKASGW